MSKFDTLTTYISMMGVSKVIKKIVENKKVLQKKFFPE